MCDDPPHQRNRADDKRGEAVTITYTVDGTPVAQGRPRMTKTGHAYTPEKSRSYRERLCHEAQIAWGNKPPSEGLVMLHVVVTTQAPKNLKAKQRKIIASGLPLPSGKRPDADNYLKMVMDSLNGIILRDDAQIYSAHVQKVIGLKPQIKIELILHTEEQ